MYIYLFEFICKLQILFIHDLKKDLQVFWTNRSFFRSCIYEQKKDVQVRERPHKS